MKRTLLSLAFLLIIQFAFADQPIANPYQASFQKAYALHPEIPKGMLEAVAFCNTRFVHITHASAAPESCAGIPNAYGVMGLTLDGKGYFSNNLMTVSQLSKYSVNEIIADPEKNILAYASAFSAIKKMLNIKKTDVLSNMPVLSYLSELPHGTEGQIYACATQQYGYLQFITNINYQQQYHFSPGSIDLVNHFGTDNYSILSSNAVTFTDKKISNKSGISFDATASADYGPALWNPAASCNYSGRAGVAVSAVTIHDVEGSYSGCISWFQNCAASVSAHYVLRSSDGQVTQMVLESNKAWHVGSENPYTIGLEHEGYASSGAWYTTAMYIGSANLVRDICSSGYGINPLRCYYGPGCSGGYTSCLEGGCIDIKGHQMFPAQTHSDPGPYWNWIYYYELINNATPVTPLNAVSGTFYDSGGPAGNYGDDERELFLIDPPGATSITLTVNAFDLELDWDYMYVYDGNSLSSPLIGTYTGTTIPGTITSTGGEMLIQFRSDCSTVDAGWNISWNSSSSSITPTSLNVLASSCPNIGVNLSWTNSGAGWYLDVSTDPAFTTFYNRDISGLTSIGCPGGFCDYPSCTSYLQFEPGTTYYWRIWNGSVQTNGSSFTTPVCTYSDVNCSGTFEDTGGSGAPHTGNEDWTFTIAPPSATDVSINFTSFDLENGYDSLYIYDGNSIAAPLLGSYTGTASPGLVTSTGSTMTLHFVSDPFTNNAGFTSTWNCNFVSTSIDEHLNENGLYVYPNPFDENTTITYQLETTAAVQITMNDVLGKELMIYSSASEAAGKHEIRLNAAEMNLSAGVYMLRLNADGKEKVLRVVIK